MDNKHLASVIIRIIIIISIHIPGKGFVMKSDCRSRLEEKVERTSVAKSSYVPNDAPTIAVGCSWQW